MNSAFIVNYRLKIGYQNLPQLVQVLERQEMSRELLSEAAAKPSLVRHSGSSLGFRPAAGQTPT
jgi:hypothetical protein